MTSVLISLLQTLRGLARSRAALHVEVLALRHQLHVLQRSRPRRLRLVSADRWLWAWLSRSWTDWQSALVIVKPALRLIADWRRRAATAEPGALMFATRGGKPLSPSNVLRRSVFPARDALGLPHAMWLTFHRTYSSWSHGKGVPGKVVARLMSHANVDTTLNVYMQVLDDSLRAAVEKVGDELFTIVHQPEGADSLNH